MYKKKLSEENFGLSSAAFAYFIWGVLPIFWKLLKNVPAFEILCHRMVWSFVFLLMLLIIQRHWKWLPRALKQPQVRYLFILSALILGLNWFIYIWAVNSGYIVQSSLGYFINPLVVVILGVIFLQERLRIGQWTAVGIAAIGVICLTIVYGEFPWIALSLAISFGIYGLIRKIGALNSIEGLFFEMLVLLVPAVSYLIYLGMNAQGAYGHLNWLTTLLLSLTGIATAFPLILFATGARRISMTNLGLLQYIAPTFQFLIGVFVYHESFLIEHLIGFSLIWIALLVYTFEGFWMRKKQLQLSTI
ncbi:EamA family transporter RarD [candidate division KSB1 bacterium]|nr:EamA family transporter RarD [candidate division KSB1 bacterium]